MAPQPTYTPRAAVLACMDARIDPPIHLGMERGELQMIRNAGGLATEDAIRSLAISQVVLGTRELHVIQHTDCGMSRLSEEELLRNVAEAAGEHPEWEAGTFVDLERNLRNTVATLKASPFIPHTDNIRAYIFDVVDGSLNEIVLD